MKEEKGSQRRAQIRENEGGKMKKEGAEKDEKDEEKILYLIERFYFLENSNVDPKADLKSRMHCCKCSIQPRLPIVFSQDANGQAE